VLKVIYGTNAQTPRTCDKRDTVGMTNKNEVLPPAEELTVKINARIVTATFRGLE
jgi:hypothetical protein